MKVRNRNGKQNGNPVASDRQHPYYCSSFSATQSPGGLKITFSASASGSPSPGIAARLKSFQLHELQARFPQRFARWEY